ncbi:lysophospholipid acyltransferase family protein [Posidoniimonas polymericola]|nr:lysophospholipid acyltransferase family protein [Posidoniimonas polymericola]
MSTLRYRAWYEDPAVDPLLAPGQPRIYVFWHENILLPLYKRGNCHLTMLLSQHRDADILARIADRFSFEFVRGSTYRGATGALRQLALHAEDHHLTITPDGPRGPRRRLAQGPIYLASKLQLPIVCLGLGYDRPWRLRSWDKFAVPRPFSRARAVVSEAISVPASLDRDGIDRWRAQIEQRLNELSDDAERWARSGLARRGERPIAAGRGYQPRRDFAVVEAATDRQSSADRSSAA